MLSFSQLSHLYDLFKFEGVCPFQNCTWFTHARIGKQVQKSPKKKLRFDYILLADNYWQSLNLSHTKKRDYQRPLIINAAWGENVTIDFYWLTIFEHHIYPSTTSIGIFFIHFLQILYANTVLLLLWIPLLRISFSLLEILHNNVRDPSDVILSASSYSSNKMMRTLPWETWRWLSFDLERYWLQKWELPVFYDLQ